MKKVQDVVVYMLRWEHLWFSLCTFAEMSIGITQDPVSVKTLVINPIAVRMAKTLLSFGHSDCNRVKPPYLIISTMLFHSVIR